MSLLHRIKDFLFINRTTRQTIAKNTFWLFVANVGGRLIRGIIVILAARILGAELYGVFAFAIGFAAIFGATIDMGIIPILMREIARDTQRKEQYISSGLVIKLSLIILNYIAMIVLATTLTPIPESKLVIIFVGLAIVFDSLRDFGLSIMRALEHMQFEAAVSIVNHTATVLFGLIAIFVWKTPIALGIAYAIGSLSGTLFIIYLLRDIIPKLKKSVRKHIVRRMIRDAWPFAFLGITAVILTNTDALMLGWFVATEQVGFYGAAMKPIQLLLILPGMLAYALFPALSRSSSIGNNPALLERALGLMAVLALPIVAGGILMSDFLVTLLYGAEYLPSAAPFNVLLFLVFLNFPAIIMGYAILAHNKQKETLKYFALAAATNVILNYIFITRQGIIGAAFATTLSQLIATTGYFMVMHKIQRISISRYFIKPLLATLLMGAAIIVARSLETPDPLVFIGALIIYPLLLLLFRDPILEEIKRSVKLP